MTPALNPDPVNLVAVTKDVVTILATLFGAWIAFSGLSTWKRQLLGMNKYDLAKKLGVSLRLFREELLNFRSILDTAGEIQAALDKFKITASSPSQAQSVEEQMAVKKWKFERLVTRWKEVAEIAVEAELVIGPHLSSHLNQCRAILNEVNNCLNKHELSLRYPDSTKGLYEESMKVLYGDPTDDFGVRSEKILNEAIDVLRTEIQSAKTKKSRTLKEARP